MDFDKNNIENLHHEEAIAKIKTIVDDTSICLFTTNLDKAPLQSRPMSTHKIDDDGTLWFFSPMTSEKNQDIQMDNRVQLFYSNNSKSEYLSLYGHASVVTDRDKIDELWSPVVKAWFKEGKDDPMVSLIKVTPEEGSYWNTKHNKAITLLKIASAAITGNEVNAGVRGELIV